MGKKWIAWLVPLATLILAAFLGGFYLGRYNNSYPVLALTQYPKPEQTESMEQAENVEQAEPLPEQTEAGDGARIDLNTAALEELERLPGVGPVLAQRILDYRELCGGFSTVEQLIEVEGIGEKSLDKLRPYLTVEGEK